MLYYIYFQSVIVHCGKTACNSLENLCIKDVPEAPRSTERHRGKKIRKFILIFQLCFKMSGSFEVSFHLVLIIPCHSEIFLYYDLLLKDCFIPTVVQVQSQFCFVVQAHLLHINSSLHSPIMWDFPLHQKAIGLELLLFFMHVSSICNVSISLARTIYYKSSLLLLAGTFYCFGGRLHLQVLACLFGNNAFRELATSSRETS